MAIINFSSTVICYLKRDFYATTEFEFLSSN